MNSMTELRTFFGTENNNGAKPGRGPQILRLSVMLALTVATVASAQTYTVLKNFTGSDGEGPWGCLALSGSTLYGTTIAGGNSYSPTNAATPGYGVVFKVNVDGSDYTVLKNFTGIDGFRPQGDLVLAGSALYGTTEMGGSSYIDPYQHTGYGVVFKLNTDGSGYTVLKNFTGSDGANPVAGLLLADSTLYGTTDFGGSSFTNSTYGVPAYGVVFKMNTDGSGYTVLKNFTGIDGFRPRGGLVLAGSTLYGGTFEGGPGFSLPAYWYGNGVIFKVNTDGSGYTVLSNSHGSDGGLVLAGSTLYGTRQGGAFKVNTDGSGLAGLTVGAAYYDYGSLVLVGGSTLYGTTAYGGDGGNGTVFTINTDGSGYRVHRSFNMNDGGHPYVPLVLAGGTLYGTTAEGGSLVNPDGRHTDFGVVFSLACLSITTPPLPLTQTVEEGTTVRYQVEAASLAPGLADQWFFDGTNALVGATNALLELTNVQPLQAGAYTVLVTNIGLAVTSDPALLSVIPPVARAVVAAVSLTGGTGSFLHLEYADSLVAAAPPWCSLTNVTLNSEPQLCFDLCQPLPAQRFYRAWQTNGPQPALDMSQATEIPLAGPIGSSVRIDYINQFGPTDAWVTLDTVTLTNTPQLYFDLGMFRQPARLYRLVPVP